MYTVLYVDDEEFNLTSFKAIFRREYNVITATSGKMGLEMLKEHEVHLIITDQRMPDMTGVEFLEAISEEYMFVRRIIITGYSDIEAIIRAINRGNIYRYITKPWDVNDLRITITNAINAYLTDKNNRDLAIELQKKLNRIEELTAEQLRMQEDQLRQEATRQLLEAESKRLIEIQNIREELSNMIVHDLKNPLGLIIGYAKMALEQYEKPDPINLDMQKMFIQSVEQAGQNMLTLVLNMLDVYRFENGIPNLRLEPVSVGALIHSSTEKVSFGLLKKNLTLKLDIPEEALLMVDKEIISRVIVNLLTNAIKYSLKGGLIYIHVKRFNGTLHVEVKDEGQGIPKDKLDKLFKKFSQVDNGKDDEAGVKSSGIGLTFVQYAIDAHKGKVWVESEEGKGANFIFEIPENVNLLLD